jgi:hypothetical protein
MKRTAADILDSWHNPIVERINQSVSHLTEAKEIAKRAIGEPEYSMRTFVTEVITLGLNCYDNAIGWVYPGGKKSDEEAKQ